jgi:hypothetical protein
MTVPENVVRSRRWPADYYSEPTPPAVLPSAVTFGCGAVSVLILAIVVAGGVWLSSGGMAQFIDFALGMSMGEVRGMYTSDVTEEQKTSLEREVTALRTNLRENRVSVASVQPFLEAIRKTTGDSKVNRDEITKLQAAAQTANQRAEKP